MKKNLKRLYSLIVCIAIIAISVTALPASALAATAVSFEDKIIFENEVFSSSEYSLMAENNEEIPESVSVTLRFDESFSCDHEDIDSDEELTAHRNELKEHYKALNESIIAQLDLEDYANISYSWYGPFIEYNYATYDDFIANDYDTLEDKNSTNLECVYIGSNYAMEPCATVGNGTSEYSYASALNHIGISNDIEDIEYDGTGINVGFIEYRVPVNAPYVDDTNGLQSAANPHSLCTTIIVGGSQGIARGANIYVASANNMDDNSYFDAWNWLLNDKKVNVVNISMRRPTTYGEYDSMAAYTDYLINNTKVTVVASAGNLRGEEHGEESTYIVSPSTGVNVICVAANNRNLAVSDYSSYLMKSEWESTFLKPTLAAPGGTFTDIPGLTLPDTVDDNYCHGTSISAPFVTGIVALLMEEFPILKSRPERVMAVLAASCTRALGQSNTVDDDVGFGIVNYERARAAMEASNGFRIASSTISVGTVVGNAVVTIPANESAIAVVTIMYNSTHNDISQAVLTGEPSFTKIRITVTDNTGNIVYYGGVKGNYSFWTINNTTNEAKIYTISAVTYSAKVPRLEYGGIACYSAN